MVADGTHFALTPRQRVRFIEASLLAIGQLDFSRQDDRCGICFDDFSARVPVNRNQGQFLLRTAQLIPGNPDVVRRSQFALRERLGEVLGREDEPSLGTRSVGGRRVIESINDQRAVDRDGTALVVEEVEPSTASSPRRLTGYRLHRVGPDDHHLLGNFVRRFRMEPRFGQRHLRRQGLATCREQQEA